MKTTTKTTNKLTLSKATVKNLTVKTGVQAGLGAPLRPTFPTRFGSSYC